MPTQTPESTVQQAIDIILSDSKNYCKTLNYALAYCYEAKRMGGSDLKTQCLYILNNITHWRHEKAKEVRQILKDFSKGA